MSSSITTLYSKIATSKVRATLIALLAFFLPFERIPSIDVFGATVRISQLIGLALIFVSIGPIIGFYIGRPRLPRLLLPAFLLSYLVSTLLAGDARRAAMIFAFTVFVALVGSAIAATLTTDQLPRIEKYLFAATAAVLTFGFYQYFGDVFGVSPAFTGLRYIYTKEIFGFPRIQSTALEPLYYGSFLLIPYCLLLARRLIRPNTVTKFHTTLFVLIVAQILLTVSRGSIYSEIAVTIVLAGYLLARRQTQLKQVGKTTLLLLAGIVLGLVMTWVPTYFVHGPKGSANAKTEKLLTQASNIKAQDDRVRNRHIAWAAFKEHPAFGLGPGGFNDYAVVAYPKYATFAPVIVNNEPLELLAESGIVGLLLFMMFVVWTYLNVAAKYVKGKFKDKNLSCWVPAMLVYTVALAIQYQTFSTLYVMHVWVVIGLLMAFGAQKKTSH